MGVKRMTSLNELKSPLVCPACANAEVPRVGFLRRIMTIDESQSIVGHTIDYECGTCFALFEVSNEL